MPGQLDLRLAGGSRRGEDLLTPAAQCKPFHSGPPSPSARGRRLGGRWCCGQWWGHQREGREPGGLTGVGQEQARQVWQVWQGGMVSQEQVMEDSRGQTEEVGSYSKGAGNAKLRIRVLKITVISINGRTRTERTGNGETLPRLLTCSGLKQIKVCPGER